MKEPLFDVIITAWHDDEAPRGRRGTHSVRIVGRYRQHDGEPIGFKDGIVALDEAIDFAREHVTAWLKGTEG